MALKYFRKLDALLGQEERFRLQLPGNSRLTVKVKDQEELPMIRPATNRERSDLPIIRPATNVKVKPRAELPVIRPANNVPKARDSGKRPKITVKALQMMRLLKDD